MEFINFLSKYNYTEENFNKTKLDWGELIKIYNEHNDLISIYEELVNPINEILIKINKVHSTKKRIKDPEHLIEKIIRKKLENESRLITYSNYKNEITDLIGVRALHLFKADWLEIHNYILKQNWKFQGKPVAFYREGDDCSSFKINNCTLKPHKNNYRSVHYTILLDNLAGQRAYCEIQVRTIFEEAWSEIDHKIRYPNNIKDSMLDKYLAVLNRISGTSDEIGELIQYYLDSSLKDSDSEEVKLKKNYQYNPKIEKPITISGSALTSLIAPSTTAYFNAFHTDSICSKCGKNYQSSWALYDNGLCNECKI